MFQDYLATDFVTVYLSRICMLLALSNGIFSQNSVPALFIRL